MVAGQLLSGTAFAGAQPAYRLLTPALSRTRRCYEQTHGHAAARCAPENPGTVPDGAHGAASGGRAGGLRQHEH